jgi:hypothetical protein
VSCDFLLFKQWFLSLSLCLYIFTCILINLPSRASIPATVCCIHQDLQQSYIAVIIWWLWFLLTTVNYRRLYHRPFILLAAVSSNLCILLTTAIYLLLYCVSSSPCILLAVVTGTYSCIPQPLYPISSCNLPKASILQPLYPISSYNLPIVVSSSPCILLASCTCT